MQPSCRAQSALASGLAGAACGSRHHTVDGFCCPWALPPATPGQQGNAQTRAPCSRSHAPASGFRAELAGIVTARPIFAVEAPPGTDFSTTRAVTPMSMISPSREIPSPNRMSNSAVLNGGEPCSSPPDAGLVADGFLPFLIVPVRRISRHRGVELECVPARGGFGAAEHHPIFMRIWLDEDDHAVGLLDGRSELAAPGSSAAPAGRAGCRPSRLRFPASREGATESMMIRSTARTPRLSTISSACSRCRAARSAGPAGSHPASGRTGCPAHARRPQGALAALLASRPRPAA